ncbi:MAG: CoA pyrophosphatase [Paracoccaceae bacterium]
MDEIDRLLGALQRPDGGSSDFDLNPGIQPPAGRVLRPAGVLVPIYCRPDGAQLILTKRASHLKHHPGQISLPGGKVEPEDTSVQAAALREAMEEISLPQGLVDVVGHLPTHETVTGFSITPILGIIREQFLPIPEAGEVEEVFSVPLSHVLDLTQYVVERRLWMGQWRHYYVVPYGPYYIWGATARILRGLAERASR